MAQHTQKNLASLFRFEVQGDTALVAVYGSKVEAHAAWTVWWHIASIVATARLFNFDDIRPKVCQHLGCIGSGKQA